MGKRLLILGGTGEAAELAQAIAATDRLAELEVIVSLAGRTQQPRQDSTRIGGFGGVEGLIDYLQTNQINLLIDATHPFAAQISHHAHLAAATVKIPQLMLIRPAWAKTGGDRWIEVISNTMAAETLLDLNKNNLAQRIFLTIGRQELSAYSHLQNQWFLMRMIDPPTENIPTPPGQILLERGPFDLARERSLLQQYHIDIIVSKNSGGDATYGKIIAARELGLPVVMVQRPPIPAGEQVNNITGAIAWLGQQL
jgi:precorrin-6A/cobalt-precorrin-6A reductase